MSKVLIYAEKKFYMPQREKAELNPEKMISGQVCALYADASAADCLYAQNTTAWD